MTRETFINTLKGYGYSYEVSGDRIIVTHHDNVNLEISSIPPGVEFKCSGNVDLRILETIPPDIVFNNGGNVYLNSLKSIPTGVIFNNMLSINLESLKTIPPGIVFNNGGNVLLNSLKSIPPGVIFNNKMSLNLESLIKGQEYDIKGIGTMRVLNLMISKGMFI